MKSDGDEGLAETQPAAPSPADPTRTSQPDRPAASPAGAARPPLAPQLRDHERYDILGEHGRGGLGRVSRAHDRELGRDIAIKELISRGALSEVRFLREALITARLEHPGIVPVYEAGRWPDGTPFYAMKLVSGRPLRDLIAERKTVDERLALLHHVIAVADAIAYAHGRGIIHRDLKPANVIVGEFGETVVIDWGLAKDLSTAEEPAVGGGPFREHRDDGLTSAGTVLGTPSYMAPEQARGEPVDPRADVFAIGAMLWELCSLERLPPGFSGQRHRILRKSGVDPDLITIVEKALAVDPARRYPDAGALAADLKAFKAGARIAARRYSLWALLTHWTRRHRPLALSGAVLTLLAIATVAFYVRGTAVERDRADRSEGDAKRARVTAEASLDELTLQHAELLLQSDPTAAVSVLAGYHGHDTMRHMQLLAEARGRGVALGVLHPHNDTVYFLAGQADGSIVSIGEDHRVRRTLDGTTTTLASDVSYVVHLAYSAARHWLAYATPQHGIAVRDIQSNDVQRLDTPSPISLAFSPDGSQLAALDKTGALTVWSTAPALTARSHDSFPGAAKIAFVAPDRIAVLGSTELRFVGLDGARTAALAIAPTAIQSNDRDIAVGTVQGELVIVSAELAVVARLAACRDRVTAVQFIPDRDLLAFGCQDGGVGIARYTPSSRTLDKLGGFPTQARVALLAADDSGEYIVACSEREAYLHHIASGLTMRLQGQAARISAIAAGTRDFKHVLTADVNGTVRVWDFTAPHARVLAHVRGVSFGSRFSPDGSSLAVFGTDPDIHIIRMTDGSITELHGHTGAVGGVRYSPDGELALSFSWDGTARLWQARDGRPAAVFDGHHTLVQDGQFIDGGRRAATVGDDGHLFVWRAGVSDAVSILERKDPLLALQSLTTTNHVVVRDSAGSLWDVSPDGNAKQIRSADEAEVTILRASQDGRFVAIGQDSGAVTVYRTADWTIVNTLSVGGTAARIEFDPHDRDLLVYSEDGFVHIAALEHGRAVPWTAMPARAHDITYAPDGERIAIAMLDGGCWFYSMHDASWLYVHDHNTEVWSGRFSPDSSTFISIDRGGTVVARDVAATFSRPSRSP